MRSITLALCLIVSACQQPADMPMSTKTPLTASRVSVERIGVFEDTLAYGDRRGVYVIRYLETGREFIGVSGIGISEVGSHSSGKSTHRDER